MGKRVMVAVIFIPLMLIIIYILNPIWPFCLPAVISLLSMISIYEVLHSTGFLKNARLTWYSIILAGIIPFWVITQQNMNVALLCLLVYFILAFIEAISSHYVLTMEKVGGAFFFSIFIPFFLSSLIRLYETARVGDYLILLPFVTAFTSDAFALFGGMLFGKHKLAPELSPKKTVEGAAAGLIGAVVCTVVYGLGVHLIFPEVSANYLLLGVYGVLGSLASQLGDLSFSYIKRQYKIKDFGKILPGHGGVLDRFDSVIFCAPLTEVLCVFLPALVIR